MESVCNINKDYIHNFIKEIKEQIKSKNLDLKDINLECICINKLYIEKNKSIAKKDILKIKNRSPYNQLDREIYKSFRTIQKINKHYHNDVILKKLELAPKLLKGDKYIPIKAINLENKKEEYLINSKNGITIINIWIKDIKVSMTGIKKILNLIEKNREFLIKSNVEIFALFQKFEDDSISEEFIKNKNWNIYPQLFKHFYCENNNLGLENLEMFDFDKEQKENFIVIDEDGIIRHLGHFYQYTVEDLIKEIADKNYNKIIVKEDKINEIGNNKNKIVNSYLSQDNIKVKINDDLNFYEIEKINQNDLKENLKNSEKKNLESLSYDDFYKDNYKEKNSSNFINKILIHEKLDDNNLLKESNVVEKINIDLINHEIPNSEVSIINSNNMIGKLKNYTNSAMPISPIITNEKFDNFVSEFTKLYKKTNSSLSVNYLMYGKISKIFKYKINLEDNMLNAEENQPEFEIKFECLKKEKEYIQDILNDIFTIEEIEKYNFEINEIPNFSIKIESTNSCNICQIVLDISNLQYYCYFCNIFFCTKCVNEQKENFTGFNSLVHKEHNLIVFQNPDVKNLVNIPKYKLGNNLFTLFEENQLQKLHKFGCDVCGKFINHDDRFICLNCRPGLLQNGGFTDICSNCFEKIHEKNQPNSIPPNNSHKKNHIYLHLIYSGVDYYDF